MRIKILAFLTGLVAFAMAVLVPRLGVHRAAWGNVCQLVEQKFFREDSDLHRWAEDCEDDAGKISWLWSRAQFLKRMQYRLDELQVSHLVVYDPEEDRRLWRGEAVDTGLRVRSIDGRWVVSKVFKGSVADQAAIQRGDELLTIDEQPPRSHWQVESSPGSYTFQRREKTFAVWIEPRTLLVDRQPVLEKIRHGVGRLEISSFRGEYFGDESWKKIVSELNGYSHIVIDLRENAGGNLVAMLRALSPFFCQEEWVGMLSQPRRQVAKGPPPPDNLDDMAQLEFLEKYREVPLKSYPSYGCFRGRVTVLVDDQSASVSEIFASSMMSRPNTRVWGRPTAGDVLIATWYNLPMLGPGYSLSIPEAQFLTTKGESLEGGGVWPQKELAYNLDEALRGEDSWLLRALD